MRVRPAPLINTASQRGQGGQSFHFRTDWCRRGPVHKEQRGTLRSVGIRPGTQRQQVVRALADCLFFWGGGGVEKEADISYPTYFYSPEVVPQHYTALTVLLGAFTASGLLHDLLAVLTHRKKDHVQVQRKNKQGATETLLWWTRKGPSLKGSPCLPG